ncbi:ABC transporter permease [Salipaludibacillus sp. CF4.18]|uniref:ABC transporter permease n=1 Tax=Salipaludibacillus sp. CF4.18 TaxID=3373081 RepID=UPI003EE5F356
MIHNMTKFLFDILDKRDLIWHLSLSDLRSNTARTYFGILWWIIDPILYMLVFYLLVEVILGRGGPDYSVFLFVALIPLKWTTSCLVDGANAIFSKNGIIQQVYVPKIIFVMSKFIVNTIKFGISMVLMTAYLWIYGVDLTYQVFYAIPVLIVHGIFILACMVILAHVGVYLRDIRNMMQYIARMLFYLSPVMYSISDVPENLARYLYINPLVPLITAYRNTFLYAKLPDWSTITVLLVISIIVLFIGANIISKFDNKYAKVM